MITVALAVIGVAAIVAVMAVEPIRSRLVGTSPLGNALLVLLAVGLGFVATPAAESVRDELGMNSIPGDNVSAFVSDIDFGLPLVPDSFKTHALSNDETEEALAPLQNSTDTVTLQEAEAERLNEIASGSGMVDAVVAGTPEALSGVADKLSGVIFFYYHYYKWAAVTKSWSEKLAARVSARAAPRASGRAQVAVEQADDRNAGVWGFIHDDVHQQLDSSGIFQAIVGIAARTGLDLRAIEGDCLPRPIPNIKGGWVGNKYYLEFDTFVSMLAAKDDVPRRKEMAETFAHLFEYGCLSTLQRSFSIGSEILSREHPRMLRYVEEWNTILRSRRSGKLTVRVTFSNPGKYDSFVRKQGKIIVGSRGARGADTIEKIVTAPASDTSKAKSVAEPYIVVKNRSTLTQTYEVKLAPDVSERLHGTYVGGLNYLRFGVLVNTGEKEDVIASQIAPFSAEAREQSRKRVDDVSLRL